MQKHREANGAEEVRVTLPNGGALMGARRAVTENATRIANAAIHYALSVNKAWIELWGNRLDEYLELPKRFVNAQTDFVEQAVDHYQESLQKLGDLTTKATQDAQSAVREQSHRRRLRFPFPGPERQASAEAQGLPREGAGVQATRNNRQQRSRAAPVRKAQLMVIENEVSDGLHVFQSENRQMAALNVEIRGDRDNGGIGRRKRRPIQSIKATNFELWMLFALETFYQDQIRASDGRRQLIKRWFPALAKLRHNGKPRPGGNCDGMSACCPVKEGITPSVIDVERMVSVLYGRDTQAACGKSRDKLHHKRGLTRVFPAHDAKKRGCHGVSIVNRRSASTRS
jgi:hypothetical protein